MDARRSCLACQPLGEICQAARTNRLHPTSKTVRPSTAASKLSVLTSAWLTSPERKQSSFQGLFRKHASSWGWEHFAMALASILGRNIGESDRINTDGDLVVLVLTEVRSWMETSLATELPRYGWRNGMLSKSKISIWWSKEAWECKKEIFDGGEDYKQCERIEKNK